jgi:hypothetical protein
MKNKPEELLQKSIMQYHEWVKNTLPKKIGTKVAKVELQELLQASITMKWGGKKASPIWSF